MLSNTSRYAIRAILYLAVNQQDNKKNIGLKQISEKLDIPNPFLGKIMQALVRSGILHSVKGPNGGFVLPPESRDISLYDLITMIDGKDMFEKCPIGLNTCEEKEKKCPLHSHYEPIRLKVKNLYAKNTIGSLADEVLSSNGDLSI